MAVLLLLEQEPMHPYGLRQRIMDWGKDQVINVSQRNAIYQIVERLAHGGLVEEVPAERTNRGPERTTFRVTPEGVSTAHRWLREMLSVPAVEYPEFAAALAFLPALPPKERRAALDARIKALEEIIAATRTEVDMAVASVPGGVDRIYLVETEYVHAIRDAELAWLRDLRDDLGTGDLD